MSAPRAYLITESMIEDHYHRWREVMKAIAVRNGFLVGHKSLRPIYEDLVDRLREDPWWTLSPTGNQDPAQFLMWHPALPDDTFMIWAGPGQLQTPEQFFGPTGFGRLNLRPLSVEGVRPWETADVPLDQLKPIVADSPEDDT